MENDVKICQSCGMPMSEDNQKGTNEDGSLSNDYCSYCFKNGQFTNNATLDEQIEIGLNYYPPYQQAQTQEEKDLIKQQSKAFLSNLKRWKTN
jgi:ABC-type lipoprotein export system ATPase subunit